MITVIQRVNMSANGKAPSINMEILQNDAQLLLKYVSKGPLYH
jgi:hypothetical protein